MKTILKPSTNTTDQSRQTLDRSIEPTQKEPIAFPHSASSPELNKTEESKVTPIPKLGLSDSNLRLPHSNPAKSVSFITPESLVAAKHYVNAMHATLTALKPNDASEKAAALQHHQLQDSLAHRFTTNIKLIPYDDRPKHFRIKQLSSKHPTLMKYLIASHDFIFPLIAASEYRNTQEQNSPQNTTQAPAPNLSTATLNAFVTHLAQHAKHLTLKLAHHLDNNAKVTPTAPTETLTSIPSTKRTNRTNRRVTISQLKKFKISTLQAAVHATPFRIENYDYLPQAGQHVVVQRKTKIGGQRTTLTDTEKMPTLAPAVVSAHLINDAMSDFVNNHPRKESLTVKTLAAKQSEFESKYDENHVISDYPKLFEKQAPWQNTLQMIGAKLRACFGRADIKT